MGKVDFRENVFYEVLKINEGTIPVQQYAILSNFKFSSFGPVRKNGKNDIVIVIRAVEANGHCIMLPYTPLLLSYFALPYLQNILLPQNADSRICILSWRADQISSDCSSLLGIP